jgi:NodT family efflux transporter outer membrane factor (OMF) lipoprotein
MRPSRAPCCELKRAASRLGIAALLLGLSACVSAPPKVIEATAMTLPTAWAAASDQVAGAGLEAQWWARFNDPVLTDLVTSALQANHSIQAALDALRQALALRDVAAAGLGPNLEASGQRSAGAGNRFAASLDASWELDLFGARHSALAVSQATARASAAGLAEVQVSIAAEVGLAYLTLRGAQAQLTIAQDNLASQQETWQINQWRAQAGVASVLDAEQARAAAEQTASQLPLLQTTIRQASHALAVLSGQAPTTLAKLLTTAAPVPRATGALALTIPADTLRRRPDVRAAEQQVLASTARVTQADAARAPRFRLSGNIGLQALSLGGLGGSASQVGALLASVALWDGGAGLAQVQAQQAALDQARSHYRATVLSALREVEDALVALEGDRLRLLRLEQATEAAGNAALMAIQRYRSGLVDFQTVLATQRVQLSSQNSLASASTDLGADHVRLYKALGGGWRVGPEFFDLSTP